METVCPLCHQRRAKRRCRRQNGEEICSLCCAGMRDSACGDCPFYAEVQRYDSARKPSAATPEKHFTIELNPEVEEAVDQAIAIYPHFVEAHFNRAAACQQKLDLGGAIRGFRQVVAVGDPDDLIVKKARTILDDLDATIRRSEGVGLATYVESQELFDRAFAFMEQRDWPRALAGFRAAVAKNDRNAPTHGNLGLCLALLGRKAEAMAELDRALEIDLRYQPAKSNRVAVERMEEGRPLENAACRSINWGREQFLRNQGR